MFDAGVVPGIIALLESEPLSFFKIFLIVERATSAT